MGFQKHSENLQQQQQPRQKRTKQSKRKRCNEIYDEMDFKSIDAANVSVAFDKNEIITYGTLIIGRHFFGSSL